MGELLLAVKAGEAFEQNANETMNNTEVLVLRRVYQR